MAQCKMGRLMMEAERDTRRDPPVDENNQEEKEKGPTAPGRPEE